MAQIKLSKSSHARWRLEVTEQQAYASCLLVTVSRQVLCCGAESVAKLLAALSIAEA